MKKILITIILCILGASNSICGVDTNPFVIYYHSYSIKGTTYTEYIILKGLDKTEHKTYEAYRQNDIPTYSSESVYGEWEISNDTIYLTPQYEIGAYGKDAENMRSIYDKGFLDVYTVPRQFLIKENIIIDITDYGYDLGSSDIWFNEYKLLWGSNLWDYVNLSD